MCLCYQRLGDRGRWQGEAPGDASFECHNPASPRIVAVGMESAGCCVAMLCLAITSSNAVIWIPRVPQRIGCPSEVFHRKMWFEAEEVRVFKKRVFKKRFRVRLPYVA